MSLTAASLQLILAWQQSRTNTGTNPTTQEGQVDHDLAGISLTTWDEVYHELFTLSVSSPQEVINLKSLLNYVRCERFALGRVLILYVKNLGNVDGAGDGRVLFGPSAQNPATLFFSSAGDGIVLVPGRFCCCGDDVTGAAALVADDMQVSDSAKWLQIDHLDGDDAIIEVAIIGSTTVTG